MAINWQELTHNRPLMIGVAGAAGLGAFVWYRNRNSSSTSSSSTGTGTSNPQGVADTTGTDVASWLSSYGQQLQTTLDALVQKQQQTGTTGTTQPAPSPKTKHLGLVKTKGDTAKNWGWYTAKHSSLWGIAQQYKISLADLKALNPGLPSSGYLPANTKVKLSSDIGPWQK